MKEVTLIYPHQLFEEHPALSKDRLIYLIEDSHFFTRYRFHKQKLAFHKATMIEYHEWLSKKGYNVTLVSLDESLEQHLKKNTISLVHCCLVYDQVLESNLKKLLAKNQIELTWYESPYFMCSENQFEEHFAPKKKKYYFTSFYHAQRTDFDILMVKGKPKGGKFSYDPENRLKIPDGLTIPPVPQVSMRPSIEQATTWANTFDHYGSIENWYYPVTFISAKRWFTSFLHERFKEYGPYQDAIQTDNSMLFHSILSPLLNVGLLTPSYVVDKALGYGQEQRVPLNSLEGFIRQVMGWREYVYGIYAYHGKQQQESNFLKHTNKLPESMWSASTGLEPLDSTIERILDTGYANHIERLMLLGNFMLMTQIDPDQVYLWFMELFIDAYDWVMIPNVYGMSQFADGGFMVTKPYFSSSNYIKKMSNYPSGSWNKVFDGLCWRFMVKNQKKFAKIPRMRFMNSLLAKMPQKKLNHHVQIADRFLKTFLAGDPWNS